MVVILHLKTGSALLNGISRCAVLIFFMISGYCTLIDSKNIQSILTKRVAKLLKVLLCTSSVYLFKDLVTIVVCHQSLSAYLLEEFSVYKILKMILFDDSLIRLHLWFIIAMIYLYLVLMAFDKLGLIKRVMQYQMLLIIILFVVNLLIGEVPYLFGYDTPVCFVRNWLLTGMPAFLLGNHIRNCNKNHNKYYIVIFCVLGVLESWIAYKSIGKGDTYLGSILLAYGVVYGVKLVSKIRCNVLSYIGSECSLFIYLYHILLGEILSDAKYRVVIVYFSCILLSLVYNCTIKMVKERSA